MKTLKLFLSIGIATGAGLAIGMLTAPRKGKHTRSRIKHELEDVKDSFETAANKKLKEAKSILNQSIETQKKLVMDQLKSSKKKSSDKKTSAMTPADFDLS